MTYHADAVQDTERSRRRARHHAPRRTATDHEEFIA
jgi:hypothetical protein